MRRQVINFLRKLVTSYDYPLLAPLRLAWVLTKRIRLCRRIFPKSLWKYLQCTVTGPAHRPQPAPRREALPVRGFRPARWRGREDKRAATAGEIKGGGNGWDFIRGLVLLVLFLRGPVLRGSLGWRLRGSGGCGA